MKQNMNMKQNKAESKIQNIDTSTEENNDFAPSWEGALMPAPQLSFFSWYDICDMKYEM